MNAFNFNHLYYFYITAKLQGITVAARHLNTSQSSLSVQIKNLEHNIGKSLFKKVGRRIDLTDDGKELYQFCRRGFEVFEEMSDHIHKSKTSMGVRINIGVSSEVDRPFITDIIAKVIRKYPKNQMPLTRLVSKESDKIIDHLKAGEIDFAITNGTKVDNLIKIHKVLQLPVMCFGSKKSSLESKPGGFYASLKHSDTSAALAAKPTILRSEIDAFFVKKKIWPTVAFESNIVSSVIRATTDGLGITLLPYAYVNREVSSGKLCVLSNETLWSHRLLIVSLTGGLPQEKANILNAIVSEIETNNPPLKK